MSISHDLTVSVVIPTLNAAGYLPELLKAVFAQEPTSPREVILVDSMSSDNTRAIAGSERSVRVVPIPSFSHGRARNLGARKATGEIVVMLTQDAMPADRSWLANLLAPLEDNKVAAVYSRQIPKPGANPMECFFLQTRFQPESPVRRVLREGEVPTLEKVFFSNVSAAIRREILLRHPFDESLIMSEDQQFSRDILKAGHAVVYQPTSVVFHSHDYTLSTVFRRYFDSVYSLTLIFGNHGIGTSVSMGLKYLAGEIGFITRSYPQYLPYYLIYNLAKSAGTLTAHMAPVIPRRILRRISLHSYHWQ